jgi:AraC family ethanolamine operon transcriptional activator
VNTPNGTLQQFDCFEVLGSSLASYDVDIKQFGSGSFSAALQQIQCDPVFISRFNVNSRIEVCGNPPPGVRTFGIPTANCQPFIWRGQHSDSNSIQIYQSSSELELMTNPRFEAIDISISEGDFNALIHNQGFPDLDEMIGAREMVICDPAIMYRLRKVLQSICQVSASDAEALEQNARLQTLIRQEVPYLLAQALLSSDIPVCKAAPNRRNRALKAAIEYTRANTKQATSVGDFCRKTGFNERTLQRAFLDAYGMTPKTYMQAFRLNCAYKCLSKNGPTNKRITEIAANFGFWHMSQFAADYYRLFNELPSETLRTK